MRATALTMLAITFVSVCCKRVEHSQPENAPPASPIESMKSKTTLEAAAADRAANVAASAVEEANKTGLASRNTMISLNRRKFCINEKVDIEGDSTLESCTPEENEYVKRRSPVIKGNKKFCEWFLFNDWKELPVDFHFEGDITRRNETSFSDYGFTADLDHSGENNKWIRYELTSGRGQGCDILGFYEVENDANDRPSLLNLDSPFKCGDHLTAFRHNGDIYLENRYTGQLSRGYVDLLDKIYVLKGRKKNLVCQFKVVPDINSPN